MTLFVYGTLKRGFCRHPALGAQQFLGEAVTMPKYRMYNTGTYPGLVHAADGLAIHGELWAVDPPCLEKLDEIEGVAIGLFRREVIELQAGSPTQDVQAYFYLPDVSGMLLLGDTWE